jgi:hypothetical protein
MRNMAANALVEKQFSQNSMNKRRILRTTGREFGLVIGILQRVY